MDGPVYHNRDKLNCLQQAQRPLDTQWVCVADCTMQIGCKKALIVLRVPSSAFSMGKALTLKQVEDHLSDIPKHPEAHLWPSEVVTLGLLHALKGVGNRAFYRWLTRDYRPLFPRLPERTRLFRLFQTHQDWTQAFLAAPTVLGVIDTYGIERMHPIHEGRSPQQIGRKGLSNHRWIVAGKLCLLLNQWGLVVGWDCATAHVADTTLQWLIQQVDGRMIVLLRRDS